MAEFGATVKESASTVVKENTPPTTPIRAVTKTQNAKFGATLPVGQTETDPAAAFRESLQQKMNAIQVEKDPNIKLQLISDLSTAARRQQAQMITNITERVRNESRIPSLKARMAELEKGGLGNLVGGLINKRFGLPPEQTSTRIALEDERQEVTRRVKLEVAQNPDITAIEALHDSFGFLNTQSRLASTAINRKESDKIRDENREEATIDRALERKSRQLETQINARETRQTNVENQKLLIQERKEVRATERKEKREEDRVLLLNSLDQDQVGAARIVSGKARDDVTIGDYIIQNIKTNKDFKDLLTVISSPDAVLDMALGGNATAQKFMINKQAEILSGTENRTDPNYIRELAVAKNDVKEMTRVMTSPTQFEVAKTRVYGPKGSTRRDKWESENNIRLQLLGTREQAEANKRIRAELAGDFLAVVNRDTFNTNINSWGGRFTAPLENRPIYATLIEQKGKNKVTIDDYVSSIQAIEDPVERAQEMKILEASMTAAAADKNKAYFGFAIDNLAPKATLERAVVRTLRGDLMELVPPLLKAGGSPQVLLQQHLVEKGKEAFREIDEAFNITDYLFGTEQ